MSLRLGREGKMTSNWTGREYTSWVSVFGSQARTLPSSSPEAKWEVLHTWTVEHGNFSGLV